MRTREEQIEIETDIISKVVKKHIKPATCKSFVHRLIMEAERRAEQRVRAEIAQRVDKACETVMSLETPLMKGDNLAVTLCSHFEDCEGEADDNGWHPKAIEGYEQVKSAIGQHFRQAIDAAREVG